jgi:ribosomal protein L37E
MADIIRYRGRLYKAIICDRCGKKARTLGGTLCMDCGGRASALNKYHTDEEYRMNELARTERYRKRKKMEG